MYIERVPNRNSPPAVLLRESYRSGKKIRKRTLANLSKLPPDVIDNLRIALKGGVAFKPEQIPDTFSIIRSLPHGHVAAVLGTLKKLDLHNLIASEASRTDEKDLVEFESSDYPEERLIACRNPIVAASNQAKREELLRQTEKQLGAIVAATQREKRPLKGADAIGVRVGKVLNKFKVGKFFDYEITQKSFSYSRKRSAIAEAEALDGVYILRTSVKEETLDAPSTVRAYKSLSQVEQAFRSYKTIDLKVRPIYHHLDDRVRTHVFLCMLAYYVEWHMREALSTLLFQDEEMAASSQISSVVAPAQRSKKALAKAATKRTEENLPVHSFATLLQDLATIVKNKIQSHLSGANLTFEKITQPTPMQQKAFDLLGVSLMCTQ